MIGGMIRKVTGAPARIARRLKSIRRPRLVLAILVVFILLISAVWGLFVPHFNRPTEGHVTIPLPAHSNQAVYKNLITPYYNTSYPTTYHILPKPAHSASLDAELLSGHQEAGPGASSHIAVTIIAMPASGITEDSSYLLFKTHPETYALSQQTINGDQLTVATKATPDYEKIYLWPHGKYLLTFDVTTGARSPIIDQEIDHMLNNLRWTEE
jgi:hypothetical protein